MKFWKSLSLCALAAVFLVSCGKSEKSSSVPVRQPDAGVLFREAKSSAEDIKSCEATFESSLVFTAGEKRYSFLSSEKSIYTAKPFALKATRSSSNDGLSSAVSTYALEENGGIWFYSRSGKGWEKADASGLDISPLEQINILSLLTKTDSEAYVREIKTGSVITHKIELKMNREILRSAIENIVTASGIAAGSHTIVQTLLNSSPPVYAYAYLDAKTGLPVRIEMDAAEEIDRIFQNIDGAEVKIRVSGYKISGTVSKVGSAGPVILPEEALKAHKVEAQG